MPFEKQILFFVVVINHKVVFNESSCRLTMTNYVKFQ
jgi:hypothetical protein